MVEGLQEGTVVEGAAEEITVGLEDGSMEGSQLGMDDDAVEGCPVGVMVVGTRVGSADGK